jgi:uracil-DNA glycosylase family 4
MKKLLLDTLFNNYIQRFEGNEIVISEGPLTVEVMLIGEAPGKDEVLLGKPFVGSAGKKLNEIIELTGMEREKLYITNAIKYRLFEINPKTLRKKNRAAKTSEIIENTPFLLEEIEIIKPKYVATLGNVPLKAVLNNKTVNIGDYHGKTINIKSISHEFILYPLYHPASIIYNKNLIDIYKNDLLKLRELLLYVEK